MMRRGKVIWGAGLLLLGVLLLLKNTGVLRIDIWGLIWPLFLLVAGVWIVWSVLSGPATASETEEATIPLEGASRARLRVYHGAGRLRVDSSASPGALASGTFVGGLSHRSSRSGDELTVEVRPPSLRFAPFVVPCLSFTGRGMEWELGLTPDVPLELDFRTGAGEALIDLTDLRVEKLQVQTGASSTIVKLPARAGFTRVSVSGGLMSLRLQVPEGVAARISASGGLADVSVDRNRFPRQGRFYQSADYETAENKVEIRAETGLGSLAVR
jgi:hypothetical protein